jgi:DNA-binding NtrC family response regulator
LKRSAPCPCQSPPWGPRNYVADGAVFIGCSRQAGALVREAIELAQANCHGLVTGATGTGKTALQRE